MSNLKSWKQHIKDTRESGDLTYKQAMIAASKSWVKKGQPKKEPVVKAAVKEPVVKVKKPRVKKPKTKESSDIEIVKEE